MDSGPDVSLANHHQHWKRNVIVGLVIFLVGIGCGWWLHNQYIGEILRKAEQQVSVSEKVRAEQQGCSAVLSQRTGDFGEYEYCQRLIQRITE